MTDKVLIDCAVLQDLIDDVSDYAVSREFKERETKWRTELLEKSRALLAAGASEGQAEPIYQILEPCEAVWSDTDWLTYESTDGAFKRIVYLHPSAEIAALEKDAERYRYIRNCGAIVDFTHAGPWKFTDDVDAAIDKHLERKAAIAKEPK